MEEFTVEESVAIPLTAHQKILNYVAEVNGFGKRARAAIQAFTE